jgi:hypothetical protein
VSGKKKNIIKTFAKRLNIVYFSDVLEVADLILILFINNTT